MCLSQALARVCQGPLRHAEKAADSLVQFSLELWRLSCQGLHVDPFRAPGALNLNSLKQTGLINLRSPKPDKPSTCFRPGTKLVKRLCIAG